MSKSAEKAVYEKSKSGDVSVIEELKDHWLANMALMGATSDPSKMTGDHKTIA